MKQLKREKGKGKRENSELTQRNTKIESAFITGRREKQGRLTWQY